MRTEKHLIRLGSGLIFSWPKSRRLGLVVLPIVLKAAANSVIRSTAIGVVCALELKTTGDRRIRSVFVLKCNTDRHCFVSGIEFFFHS